MPRIQPKTILKDEKRKLLNELWSLVTLLDTKEEIENFFRDLLSETESVMLARRIRIARLLLEGKSYENIREAMNTSYSTIGHVHQWLQGRNEGYITMLPRLEKELEAQRKTRGKQIAQRQTGNFGWLKKRYPLQFLLFNLLDLPDKSIAGCKRKKS